MPARTPRLALLVAHAAIVLICAGAFAAAALAAGLPPDAADRHAKGEAYYQDQWKPIAVVWEAYRALRDDIAKTEAEAEAIRAQLKDQTDQLTAIRARVESETRPIRTNLTAARKDLSTCERTLRTRPPSPPRLEKLPIEPHTHDHRSHSLWRSRYNEVDRRNKALEKQYNDVLNKLKKAIEQAKRDKPAIQQTIEELNAQVAEIRTKGNDESEIIRQQQIQAQNQLRPLTARSSELSKKLLPLADALAAVPEDVRAKHDVHPWADAFRSLEELKALRAEVAAQIQADRAEQEAKAQENGGQLPDDWKHPQQDALDGLTDLIRRHDPAFSPDEEPAPPPAE